MENLAGLLAGLVIFGFGQTLAGLGPPNLGSEPIMAGILAGLWPDSISPVAGRTRAPLEGGPESGETGGPSAHSRSWGADGGHTHARICREYVPAHRVMVARHCVTDVPSELVDMVRDCVERRGPTGASKALGLSRTALLSALAGVGVSKGTLAILREAKARREAARK